MYNPLIIYTKGYKMSKFLTLFAVLLLLASPVAMAEEAQTQNPNSWVEDVDSDFGTDSYDEDGCFC